MADTDTLMTTEELLALPEDGVDRDLIRGELRERPMTRRGRSHTRTCNRIGFLLERWLEEQTPPRGEVLAGEAGFRLRKNPDTTVGIQLVYISGEVAARHPEDTFLIDDIPTLAVEILSPSDKQQEIDEKVSAYLEAGVPRVWIVNPCFRTVAVYRPDTEPELFNVQQEITAEPHLPGFKVPVRKLFEI